MRQLEDLVEVQLGGLVRVQLGGETPQLSRHSHAAKMDASKLCLADRRYLDQSRSIICFEIGQKVK